MAAISSHATFSELITCGRGGQGLWPIPAGGFSTCFRGVFVRQYEQKGVTRRKLFEEDLFEGGIGKENA
jgi:hypothetical protein